ncbi:alpha/beta fold hydrolase [Microbacterium sp. W4I20]|uniref:alpha/beta fold hydrolase n=1 Tax=Microbacterium sp. W4I20 TaxID=3042262 RepID=UPI00277EB7E0|nr:alpha/beta hydrolase [Microbacterium sp. W4I20]MDQ0727865.1 pimeloyl-ACP methyl ester carboxylesterase [Microbacterium sp. W4I20]
MAPPLTYVLVHGAFTDASCWWPITLRLLGSGHRVLAPPIMMRSFAGDCAYIRCVVDRIDGPVILVGHGYGGAVAAVAGASTQVVGLVFIDGYVLDAGENIAELRELFPRADIARHLVAALFRDERDTVGTELSIDIPQFPFLVAEGLSDDEAQVLAVSQRPIAVAALSERAPTAAWRHRPTWGVVSLGDRTIHPDLQRFGCRRAQARRILELDAPHLVMRTHPTEIVDLLLDAAADLIP